MMGFRRKPDTPVRFEPVASDCSIYPQPNGTFNVVLREDGNQMTIPKPTLEEAQKVWVLFKPDAWLGGYGNGDFVPPFSPHAKSCLLFEG